MRKKCLDNYCNVVILGAGASCAAIPHGDKTGKKIPAMKGFVAAAHLSDCFSNITLKTSSDNFEEIFMELEERSVNEVACLQAKKLLEQKTYDFIKNFEFIFSCRKKIWSNPELSNITFYGMGFSYAYISRDFPLTIGELLYHYENKSFVITNPNEPEYPTYIYYSCGSLLTGSNSYNGFNLKTRTPFYDKLSYGCRNQLMAISNYKKPYFSDVSTDLDIKQLTNILRKKTVF